MNRFKHGGRWLRGRAGRDDVQDGEGRQLPAATGDLRYAILATLPREKISPGAAPITQRRAAASAAKRLGRQGQGTCL